VSRRSGAPDDTTQLGSPEPLGKHDTHLAQSLHPWARRTPEAVLTTAPRGTADLWYGQARAAANALTEALLRLRADPDRSAMLLVGNSVAHLQVPLAVTV